MYVCMYTSMHACMEKIIHIDYRPFKFVWWYIPCKYPHNHIFCGEYRHIFHSESKSSLFPQCEAPKITKLVHITPTIMVSDTQITIFTGTFVKQRSHHWGASHCRTNHWLNFSPSESLVNPSFLLIFTSKIREVHQHNVCLVNPISHHFSQESLVESQDSHRALCVTHGPVTLLLQVPARC